MIILALQIIRRITEYHITDKALLDAPQHRPRFRCSSTCSFW